MNDYMWHEILELDISVVCDRRAIYQIHRKTHHISVTCGNELVLSSELIMHFISEAMQEERYRIL